MQEIRGHSRKIYKEKTKSFYFYLLPNIEGVTHISSLYCVVELGMQISKDQHMLISTEKTLKKEVVSGMLCNGDLCRCRHLIQFLLHLQTLLVLQVTLCIGQILRSLNVEELQTGEYLIFKLLFIIYKSVVVMKVNLDNDII